MNNDFIYKPKNDSSNSSDTTNDTEDMAPEELSNNKPDENVAVTPSEPTKDKTSGTSSDSSNSAVVTSAKPRKGHGPLVFIVMLLLLLAAAASVYYWQHQKVQNLQTSKNNLSAQVSSLQSQLAQKQSTSSMGSTGMPGMSSSSSTADVTDIVTVSPATLGMDNATVSVLYSNKASETWVESGTAPDKLTTVASHVKANSETDTQNFNLTGLKMGTRYYYRAAGMVDGKTVYGGIVTFTTTK